MTFGLDNLTTNGTANATADEVQTEIGELLGEQMAGSYSIVGFVFLAAFGIALYKANVSLDTGAAFMVPALFVFGKYGLLPGATGTMYGLLLSVVGLVSFGIYRWFR